MNLTLAVSASVTDSVIELTCSSQGIILESGQYLQWTENGKELLTNHSLESTSSGSRVVAIIHNPSYLDYGIYTCRCYNNLTLSLPDVQEMFYSDHDLYPHCSEPFSVSALPSG